MKLCVCISGQVRGDQAGLKALKDTLASLIPSAYHGPKFWTNFPRTFQRLTAVEGRRCWQPGQPQQ